MHECKYNTYISVGMVHQTITQPQVQKATVNCLLETDSSKTLIVKKKITINLKLEAHMRNLYAHLVKIY